MIFYITLALFSYRFIICNTPEEFAPMYKVMEFTIKKSKGGGQEGGNKRREGGGRRGAGVSGL